MAQILGLNQRRPLNHAEKIPALLKLLVESKSPSGREMSAVVALENVAHELGFQTRRQRVGESANVISPPSLPKRHELLFCSHIDTVPSYVNDSPYYIRDGELFGLGACDAKASVLAMMLAYSDLEKANFVDRIGLAVFVGEERDGAGALRFAESGYKPKYAIIGEPTEMCLPWGQAGYVSCVVKSHSSPRHAFSHRPSDSIETIIKVIGGISEYISLKGKGLPSDERPTVFIENIGGGSRDGFWCARQSCEATVVINPHPHWDTKALISALRLVVSNLSRETDDISLAFSVQSWDPGIVFGSEKLRGAIERGLLANNVYHKRTYMSSWTDAATLAWKGVNTAVLGPGSLEVAHSEEEHVSLKQLELAAHVYRDTAAILLGEEGE